jgi:hypothetical protein
MHAQATGPACSVAHALAVPACFINPVQMELSALPALVSSSPTFKVAPAPRPRCQKGALARRSPDKSAATAQAVVHHLMAHGVKLSGTRLPSSSSRGSAPQPGNRY